MPSGINTISIGGGGDAGYPFNGGIAAFYYYPVRLTDAQLQELTTL